MPGFDAIYKQTVTLFNRYTQGEKTYWVPTVLEGVHLITDKSAVRDSYGGKSADNARLHVRYEPDGDDVYIGDKQWLEPLVWRREGCPCDTMTFSYGKHEDFDFFIDGLCEEADVDVIDDDDYERKGFYNYMNAKYDNVFVITSVSKYNLIPHFEIGAR